MNALNPYEARPQGKEQWLVYRDCWINLRDHSARSTERATLVFIHGRLGTSDIWHALIGRLTAYYRCISIELPGFGESWCRSGRGLSLHEMADLLLHVVRHLDADPVVLIGHDVGGAVAQLTALRAPRLVTGLVLINASCLLEPVAQLPLGYAAMGARWKLALLLKDSADLDDEESRQLLRPWLNRDTRSRLLTALAAIQASWPGFEERRRLCFMFENMPQPTLLLWGGRDRLNPPDSMHALLRTLPDVHFIANEDCGHWPCLERPSWIADRMREFLFRAGERKAVFFGSLRKVG